MLTREDYASRMNAAIPDEPEIPDIIEHVWHWFWGLSDRRQRGFDSPNPLSYVEIDAWLRLSRTLVLPQEIDLILVMDSAWLAAVAEMRDERSKDKKR